MSTPEVRLSLDGKRIAVLVEDRWIRFVPDLETTAEYVADWTPLLPVSNQDGAEPEQLPPVLDRAADELHRGH